MYPIIKSNLGRRIVLLVAVSMILLLIALAISGWLAVRQSSDRVSHERQGLAQATAKYLDYILQHNLERLDTIQFAQGVDIEDDDLEPEKRALHSTYLGSMFDNGVFITDQQGIVLWAEPFRQDFVGTNLGRYQPIWQSFLTKKPLISNVFTIEPDDKKVIFMATPLRNREGIIVGLAGGQIDPLGRALQEFTRPVDLGETSYIDIIDNNGVVLASSAPQRISGRDQEDANQGEAEVTELAHLGTAPWSVAVSQSEKEALAPVRTMEQRFIIFGLAAVVIALFLSWGMARSLVKPIGQLTTAARSISQGDLSQPIPQLGSDEIGELSRSFDAMRIALKNSLEEIQEWNRELETKVEERTGQLEDSYREIERKEAARGELLKKILAVQEEERKRIARELHDETTQSLVGLVMRLETATAIPDEAAVRIKNILTDIRDLTVRTLDNVHKIIFDLRPSVLDDLGLLSALRWHAENRLGALDIKVRVEVTGEERKLPPQVEIALFRVVQEAITNIVKHAGAHNVVLSVEFKDSIIGIEVEDDGKGFDLEAVSCRADKTQGLGLLGMKERVTLLGGKFHVGSQPDGGTHLTIEVPLD
jgi:signal transduction histidine kinase/sensor domain CHASE-containing protein